MSITVRICYPQKPDIESCSDGSETKNPLPSGMKNCELDIVGLSWVFLDEDFT